MKVRPHTSITRRKFLAGTTAAMATVTILPSGLLKAAPNDKPDIAAVGVGGKGWGDITETSKNGSANVVAFCDVEMGGGRGKKKTSSGYGAAAERWPDAKRYQDWREMLDKEGKRLNGITVSTPDHMHAPVSMTAIQMGIATYTQKPMTRTIHEARQLTLAARKAGVVTQMGNQGHSSVAYRSLVQLIQGGTIGKVKEAHTWSNRPIWPQGLDRPAGNSLIPETLNWDLWLGVAPERPFVASAYHPFAWRGWYDFGAGALGDMGCHIIDPVYWSLGLTAPRSVSYEGPTPKPETFPTWEILTYEFPGTQYTASNTLRMRWYDGKRDDKQNLPPADLAPLPAGENLPTNGCLLIGDKGVLLCEHGGRRGPRLLPEDRFKDYPMPPLEEVDHYLQWTNAIRGEGKTTSNFDYAGPLTETVLLGTVASHFPGEPLQWDATNLRFTNVAKANDYVQQAYRKGWEVKGLS
jgi:predicted dehydrogenase